MRSLVKILFEHKGYSFVLAKEIYPSYGDEKTLILYRLSMKNNPYWRLVDNVGNDDEAIEESKRIIDRVFKNGNPFNIRYTHYEVIVDTLKMRAGSHTRRPNGTHDFILEKGNIITHRTNNFDGEGFYERKGQDIKGSASDFLIWNEKITPA